MVLIPVAAAALPGQPSLAEFEADLASHDSATEALEKWCTAHAIGTGPVRASLIASAPTVEPGALAATLALGAGDAVTMRNVRLSCGDKVLSVAWNWYVPQRLTPEMNAQLATSDVPFGKVARDLGFWRETLGVVRGRAENCPEDTISTHRALLRLPDGRPLAYLVECYTAANLGK